MKRFFPRSHRVPGRACLLLAALLALPSCSRGDPGIMTIWTDRSEFVSYAELFNASQKQYRAVVEYRENPADAIIKADDLPDIVVGPWLKGEKTRTKLIQLDYLFNEIRVNSSLFYRPLLELGNVHGRQYLLPVSFNLAAIIFSKENQSLIKDTFFLPLDEIKLLAKNYNEEKNGRFSRMGFSPRWDPEFLYLVTRMYGTQYEESNKFFTWYPKGLQESLDYVRDWSSSVNGSVQAEDDYQFKNLYDPPYKQVTSGRSLFSYLSSRDLLILPSDKVASIDFRWVTKNELTPVEDGMTYLGICKQTKHMEAAEAFLIWFFNEKNQKAMLERKQSLGLMDRNFGIADGFSALRPVNEKVFPLFYPGILGHLPPQESLMAPRILPNNWDVLKAGILMPWLTASFSSGASGKDTPTLESRIQEWQKAH